MLVLNSVAIAATTTLLGKTHPFPTPSGRSKLGCGTLDKASVGAYTLSSLYLSSKSNSRNLTANRRSLPFLALLNHCKLG